MSLEAQAPRQSPNLDDEQRDDFGDDDLYDDEGVQEPAKDAPADGDADDDYAKTFDVDSPGAEESGIGNNADVSTTNPHESMTSSPDASHTLPAAAPVAVAAPPLQPAAASSSIMQPPSAPHAAPPAVTPPIQSPTAASMTTTLSAPAPTPAEPVNIDKILENMSRATQNAAPDIAQDGQPQQSPVSVSTTAYLPNAVPATSLPARPPVFDHPAHAHPSPGEFHYPHQSANGTPGHSSNHVAAGPPGVGQDMRQHLPPPPASQYYSNPHVVPPSASSHGLPGTTSNDDVSRLFEQYLDDERRYTADGKWTDRFPSGSRVFVGNVSQNKVSKREVFDLFYTCGRIAQISLKNSYGFVQFHTSAEGSAAVRSLKGAKIGGQTINVEVSKPQGKDSNRQRSPDRRGRGGNQSHQNRQRDRGYNNARGRNDYRSPSPRRDYQRHSEGHGRDRGYYDSDRGPRGRSRSPHRERANYRERSPGYSNPHGVHGAHGGHGGPGSVIPPRYGPDVPDVQIFQMEDLPAAFVDWVCSGFGQSQLKVDVKRLYGQNPYDREIESQLVSQGVRAVVTLTQATERAQNIPVRVFIRGPQSVNYEDYANLPPHVAARIVQEKTQPPFQQNQYPQYPPQPPPSHGYPQQPSYPSGPHQQQASPSSSVPPQLAGIDPATLQQIIASIQSSGTSGASQYGSQAPTNSTNPDLARILATLNSSGAAANSGLPPQQGAAQYSGWSQQGGSNAGGPARENPSSQVESIMANLARFRQ